MCRSPSSVQTRNKPPKEYWSCAFGHKYSQCRCHPKLTEHGQDESAYRSGNRPSIRRGIDGRSYPVSKSQGISEMVLFFEDYVKRVTRLLMTAYTIFQVNASWSGRTYADGTPMLPYLVESPGLRIINPTAAGDGYWNYDKT